MAVSCSSDVSQQRSAVGCWMGLLSSLTIVPQGTGRTLCWSVRSGAASR